SGGSRPAVVSSSSPPDGSRRVSPPRGASRATAVPGAGPGRRRARPGSGRPGAARARPRPRAGRPGRAPVGRRPRAGPRPVVARRGPTRRRARTRRAPGRTGRRRATRRRTPPGTTAASGRRGGPRAPRPSSRRREEAPPHPRACPCLHPRRGLPARRVAGLTPLDKIPPRAYGARMVRSAAAVVTDGLAPFEFGVVCEVFGRDRSEDGVPRGDFRVRGPVAGQPVRTSVGARVVPDHGLDATDDVDLVVVPAIRIGSAYPREVLDAVRRTAARGALLLSVCSGVFLLAAAGVVE